jgi:hypothetical protein
MVADPEITGSVDFGNVSVVGRKAAAVRTTVVYPGLVAVTVAVIDDPALVIGSV